MTINSDSTHQKGMKFAFIVTGSIFLQLYCVSDNVATTPYALKWDVKNGIAFLLQFFSLISDGLGGVHRFLLYSVAEMSMLTLFSKFIFLLSQSLSVWFTGRIKETCLSSLSKIHFLALTLTSAHFAFYARVVRMYQTTISDYITSD